MLPGARAGPASRGAEQARRAVASTPCPPLPPPARAPGALLPALPAGAAGAQCGVAAHAHDSAQRSGAIFAFLWIGHRQPAANERGRRRCSCAGGAAGMCHNAIAIASAIASVIAGARVSSSSSSTFSASASASPRSSATQRGASAAGRSAACGGRTGGGCGDAVPCGGPRRPWARGLDASVADSGEQGGAREARP